MTDDEKLNLINLCVKESREHSRPSPATLKFMEEISLKMEKANISIEVMKTEMNSLKESNNLEHNYIKDELGEIKHNQEKYMADMKNFMQDLSNSKADKWVEKFLVWVGITIGSVCLSGLCFLIYRTAINMQ